MTSEQFRFMQRLQDMGGRAFPNTLQIYASREQDKARQKCRRVGWVNFSRMTWEWELTSAGRKALALYAA